MREDPKSPLQSKGIMGGVVALVGIAAAAAGVDVTDHQVGEIAALLVSAAGALLAIIGRWTAKRPIGRAR